MEIKKMEGFGGEYWLLSENLEVQGRALKRLPPRRGDIKRQIFASIALSFAQFLRAMGNRAHKLNHDQIVLLLSKICACSDRGSRMIPLMEALNNFRHVDIQNYE